MPHTIAMSARRLKCKDKEPSGSSSTETMPDVHDETTSLAATAVQQFINLQEFQKVVEEQVQRHLEQLHINDRNQQNEATRQAAIDQQFHLASTLRKVEGHQRLSGWKG